MTTNTHKMNETLYHFVKVILCRMKISCACNGEGTNVLFSLNVIYCYFSATGERLLLREAVVSVVKSTSCKCLSFLSKVGDLLACLIKYNEFWFHLQF